jgi:Mat/Ecp fimbriae periplasmic chaperone
LIESRIPGRNYVIARHACQSATFVSDCVNYQIQLGFLANLFGTHTLRTRHFIRILALSLGIFFVFALSSQVQAQISVSRLIIDIGPDSEREDIVVGNIGEEVAYVEIEISEYLNPGTPEEIVVVRDSPRELGILASPNRMILQPGEKAILRLAVIERPDDIDRVFKITVTPVVGEIESSENAIKFVYAYGLVIILRPDNPQPAVTVARDGRMLSAANSGNTMVQFGFGVQCDATGANCVDIANKRVYPNSTWEYEPAYDTPVTFKVKTLDEVVETTY